MKSYAKQKNKDSNRVKISTFQDNGKKMLDVTSCKCNLEENCSCDGRKRIPRLEVEFVNDQRGDRKMFIECVDHEERIRSLKRERRNERVRRKGLAEELEPSTEFSSEQSECITDSSNEQYLPVSRKRKMTELIVEEMPSTSSEFQIRSKPHISKLALACERTSVSDRSAALIASSVLEDFGVITAEEKSHVIDRSKIRRQRDICRKTSQKESQYQVKNLIPYTVIVANIAL